MQTERNLQNSRLNLDETSSLVDLERRIPAKWAFFAQVMRESRKMKTRWRMMQSGANQSLCSNSLITREDTGNFYDSWLSRGASHMKKPHFSGVLCRNSLLDGTGNFKARTGYYWAGTGNFLPTTGKPSSKRPSISGAVTLSRGAFYRARRERRWSRARLFLKHSKSSLLAQNLLLSFPEISRPQRSQVAKSC